MAVYSNEFILGTVGSVCMSSENYCETTKSLTYLTLAYCTKISDVDELKRRIISEWAALSHTVIDSAVREWRQCLRACVHARDGQFEHLLK